MRALPLVVLLFIPIALRGQDPTGAHVAPGHEGRLDVPGGRIWYRVVGGGSGTPVILLHGGPGDPSVYLKSLEALGDERIVVRYDQLGAGYSDVVHDTVLFKIPHFVEELDLLRQHLALEHVVLYGLSWGATLAVEYYHAHPEHVTSMILAGETLDIPAFAANVVRLFDEMPDSLARAVRLSAAGEPHDSAAVQAALKEFSTHFARSPVAAEQDTTRRLGNRNITSYMLGTNPFAPTGTLRSYDATPLLKEIRVPVLFLVGEYDVAGPEIVRHHASLTPGARFVVVPNAGHHIQWDNLPATLAAVRSFLREVEAGR